MKKLFVLLILAVFLCTGFIFSCDNCEKLEEEIESLKEELYDWKWAYVELNAERESLAIALFHCNEYFVAPEYITKAEAAEICADELYGNYGWDNSAYAKHDDEIYVFQDFLGSIG